MGSTTSGKATYVGLAATAAAGAFGGYKYVEHGDKTRKSKSRKKLGLAVAGLAATAAAGFGAYKGREWYQARQNAGEAEFDDEDAGVPQSSGKNTDAPVSSSGDQSKKNKNKPKPTKKSNKWMIYGAVIVLGLAVIGGAVYYFLFMTEEGSEEDPVPEGMDQV